MKVTIVVPSKDRHRNLDQFLANNLTGLPSAWHILIVDASVNMYTTRLNDSRVQIVYAQRAGQFYQKMQGATIARVEHESQYVIFLDDDIILDLLAYQIIAEELKQDAWISGRIVAGSLNIVNFKSSKDVQRMALSFGSSVGKVYKSTYTTSLCDTSGSPCVEWVLGGACIWSIVVFTKDIPNYEMVGKAYCEDLFLSTWAKNEDFGEYVSLSQVRCSHYDQYEVVDDVISKQQIIKDGWSNGKNEMLARKMIVKNFPQNYNLFSLRCHTLYQSLLGLIFGLLTMSFKRMSYNLGRIVGL